MSPRRACLRSFAAAVLLCWPLAAPAAQAPPKVVVAPGGGRIILESGWALPLGDLADGLDATAQGVGVRPGFELGFRWRFPLSRSLSLAPSFHIVDFGDATGLGDDGESSLGATSMRYGLELLHLRPGTGPRPLVGVAPSIVHNRLQGPGKDHLTLVDDAADVVGLSARVGLQISDFEFSVVYHLNRFASWRFFAEGLEHQYNWDSVSVRLGWLLP